jgi:hypothetical protein
MRRWLIDLPTRIHLWSAELEIRHHRTPSDVDAEVLQARRDNLDVLRDYRKSRQYPRNDTELPSTPYFVDTDGRHCAVAHLMRASGHHDDVRRIAATANLARIDAMDPVVLDSWARRSGLSKRELARIQPNYAHPDQSVLSLLLWAALVLIPFAVLSFVIGWIRPDRAVVKTVLVIATVLFCTVLSMGSYTVFLGGPGSGPGTIEVLAWYVVVLGPIAATVTLAILARRDVIPAENVPPISGVAVGGLMAVLAAAYLVVGAILVEPDEPAGLQEPGPPPPSMYGDLTVSYPVGFAVLLIGLLCLATSLTRLRRIA